MADVCITEYTDPACPWAYSAEPFRRRLDWLYGERLEWRVSLVVLSESPDDYAARGFTPAMLAAGHARIAAELERYRAAFHPIMAELHPADPDGMAAVAVSWLQGCAVQATIAPDRFDMPGYLAAVREFTARLG